MARVVGKVLTATKIYFDSTYFNPTLGGGTVEGTAVLSTGEAGGTKFLREDGDGTCSWQTPTGAPHTQNTDTGTTGNTFTVDSDSTTGKIIVDVALGAADLSLTLTNETLTASSKTATLQNKTGTIALTSDIPTVSDVAYDVTSWDANTDAPSKNAVRDKIELLDSAKLNLAGGFMNGGLVFKTFPVNTDGSYTLVETHHVIVLATDGGVTADVSVDFDSGWDSDGRDYIICAVDIDPTYDVVLTTSIKIFELPNGTTTNTITLTDLDNGKVFIFKALTTVNGSVWKQTYPDLNIPTISNTAYDATTWDANLDGASKDAIRDQVESMLSTLETKAVVAGKKVYHGVASYADLAFSNANKALTLSAITYWYKGVQYTTATTVTCDLDLTADRDNSANTLTANTLYYFYFKDATGKLYWSDAAWNFEENVFVASVFWNGSAGACQNETHNHTRDIDWHIWAHDTIGTRYESGSGLTYPSVAVDGSLQIETGLYHDEDIDFATGQCTTMRGWYKAGASVFTFADYALPYVGTTGQPQWLDTDDFTLKNVGASDFVRMWVYASADISRPIYMMPTHRATAYNTILLARADTAPSTIGTNVNAEYKLIYSFIFQGNGDFIEAVDYRLSSPVPSGGTPSITASGVTFTPANDIVATNVQSAIEEVVTDYKTFATAMSIVFSRGRVLV